MTEELSSLLFLVLFSLLAIVVFGVPVIIWKLIKRKSFFSVKKKPLPPIVVWIGILAAIVLSVQSFISKEPYFGIAFLTMAVVFIFGFIVTYVKKP